MVQRRLARMREPNLPTDPEASRERFATCHQPDGNREGSTFLSVSTGRRETPHHPGVVGMLFRPSVVFAKDRSSRLFFLHARHADLFPLRYNRLALARSSTFESSGTSANDRSIARNVVRSLAFPQYGSPCIGG